VLNKWRMAKHFEVAITDTSLRSLDANAPLRPKPSSTGSTCCATIAASQLAAPGVVAAYKDLAHVERDFRHLKMDDIDLRAIHHRLEQCVRSHVVNCMLAAYVVWHLREAHNPLDERPSMFRQRHFEPELTAPWPRRSALFRSR
jgi:transposase